MARERSKNVLELKLDVVKEVVWKHVMEREVRALILLIDQSIDNKITHIT